MSLTFKSIGLGVGVFVAAFTASSFVSSLFAPERPVDAERHQHWERKKHREEDRLLRQELEGVRELNRGLEKKVLELEEKLTDRRQVVPVPELPEIPAMPQAPAAPGAPSAPKFTERPKASEPAPRNEASF